MLTNQPEAIKRASLKKLAESNDLRSLIVFATAPGGIFHMAMYSKSPEQEDKLAQLANRVQAIMGWPENMQLVPDRLLQLQEKNRVLEAKIIELQHALQVKVSSGI